jgi:hypothetical protein
MTETTTTASTTTATTTTNRFDFIIYIEYFTQAGVVGVGRRHTTRPPASFDSQIYIHTAHQQTTTCFKIDFFSRNFKMRGDGNHDDEQV